MANSQSERTFAPTALQEGVPAKRKDFSIKVGYCVQFVCRYGGNSGNNVTLWKRKPSKMRLDGPENTL